MHERNVQCEEEGGEIVCRSQHCGDDLRGPAHASEPAVTAASCAAVSGVLLRRCQQPPIHELLAARQRLHGQRRRTAAAQLLLAVTAGFNGQ